VSSVLDLRIGHERFESSSDPGLNGHLNYPNDIDRSLNETVTDKIRKYRTDYNNNPPNTISFIPDIVDTSGRLHSDFVCPLFLQVHRETDLVKASVLRIILNIDGVSVTSRSHSHPSHSQTSRLLTSCLSLGVPVPHSTQCM